MTQTVQQAKNEIARLRSDSRRELEALSTAHREEREKLSRQTAGLEAELGLARTAASEGAEALAEARLQLAQTQGRLREAEARRLQLEESARQLEARAFESEGRAQSLSKNVEAYLRDFKAAEDRYEELVTVVRVKEERLKEKEQEAEALRRQAAESADGRRRADAGKGRDADRVQEKYERLKALHAALERKFGSQAELVQELEDALEARRKEVAALQAKCAHIQTVREDIEAFERRIQAVLLEKERAKSQHSAQVELLERQLAGLTAENRRLAEESREAESRAARLREAVKEKLGQVEETIKQLLREGALKDAAIQELTQEVVAVKATAKEKLAQMAAIFNS